MASMSWLGPLNIWIRTTATGSKVRMKASEPEHQNTRRHLVGTQICVFLPWSAWSHTGSSWWGSRRRHSQNAPLSFLPPSLESLFGKQQDTVRLHVVTWSHHNKKRFSNKKSQKAAESGVGGGNEASSCCGPSQLLWKDESPNHVSSLQIHWYRCPCLLFVVYFSTGNIPFITFIGNLIKNAGVFFFEELVSFLQHFLFFTWFHALRFVIITECVGNTV